MKNHAIVPYATENYLAFLAALKESILYANLQFCIKDLQLIQEMSDNEMDKAIIKAISICHFVGIESKFHFKKIYTFDADKNTIKTDWRMSKKGFNLVVMQFQKINQKNAIWFWQLADN
jgi:hypothetical protein